MPRYSLSPIDDNDDVLLLGRVSSLVSGLSKIHAFDQLAVFRVDNWFDDKWAGFSGVMRNHHNLAAKGYYDLVRKNQYLPPFHESRLLTVEWFGDGPLDETAAFFFSTNNSKNGRASFVATIPLETDSWQWYVGFKQSDEVWKDVRHRNISRDQIQQYVDHDA